METLCYVPALEFQTNKFAAFDPLTLETKAIYDSHIDFLPGAVTSPLYFQSLYAWNFTSVNRYKIFDGHLCIFVDDTMAMETFALPPLGELGRKSFSRAVCATAHEFERCGLSCVFHEVSDFMLPHFSGIEGYRTDVSYDRNWSDYIYTYDGLAAGLQKGNFRAARREFEREFLPGVREMTSSDKDIVRAVTQRFFCAERNCSDCFCGCELEVASRIMDGWDTLGVKGLIVESGGEALAFGIVCYQKDSAFFISKKLRRRTKGLDSYLTAAMMGSVFTGCRYINYSDDLGSDGLREYKTCLAKHTLSHRYTVRLVPE